jgi:hypothetical protein
MAVSPVYGVRKRFLLTEFEHVVSASRCCGVLNVDLSVSKVCSQPFIGDDARELFERTIRRPIDHRMIVKPAVGIRFDDGYTAPRSSIRQRNVSMTLEHLVS